MSRPLAAALTVALAVTVVAALFARGPDAQRPQPTASASVAPSATASATGSATTSLLDDRFGLAVIDGDIRVRSESDPGTISSFGYPSRSFVFHSHAISPDGRRIAVWGGMDAGAVLSVRTLPSGAPRAVFTAASDLYGNAYAWSSDGAGLVVAIDNGCYGIPLPACTQAVGELWTVDLDSGATERVATGKIWLPVTWDRANGLIVAGTTGEGGYLLSYDVIDLRSQPHRVTSFGFEPPTLARLAASSDARFVVMTGFAGTTTIAWWPLSEPSRRVELQVHALSAAWRPGTSELWWVGGLTPAGCSATPCAGSEVVALDVATGLMRTVARGAFPPALAGFRPDGSAAIVAGNAFDVTVVDAATGRAQTVSARGQLLGSVRLR